MPKGQTPRQRKFRKETKPLRQATRMINDSLEKIKKTPGMVGMAGIAGKLMSQGMDASKVRNAFKKARLLKPSGRISELDIKRVMEKGPRKFPNPRQESTRDMEKKPRKFPNTRQESTRMDKGPRKMTPLKRKTK